MTVEPCASYHQSSGLWNFATELEAMADCSLQLRRKWKHDPDLVLQMMSEAADDWRKVQRPIKTTRHAEVLVVLVADATKKGDPAILTRRRASVLEMHT